MMSRAAIIQAEPQSVCPLTDSCTHLCWEISQQLRRAPPMTSSRLDSPKRFDACRIGRCPCQITGEEEPVHDPDVVHAHA